LLTDSIDKPVLVILLVEDVTKLETDAVVKPPVLAPDDVADKAELVLLDTVNAVVAEVLDSTKFAVVSVFELALNTSACAVVLTLGV
jgi:hypothetical protein